MLAASPVYEARCTLNKTQLWDKTLEIHTDYTGSQLIDFLVSFHAGVSEDKLRVVFNKYSNLNIVPLLYLPQPKGFLLHDTVMENRTELIFIMYA
ncbi:hypothetical protein MKW98_026680 [Papaver atlanticum]|uniref:Cyclin C-terminal domain-containing protein n=1 Tax=Papaver atlanticum TaxID=357466 RepID=A0AAD4X5L0_9MAGN|nr:hypothetical protein MKW98_026680 [Papaver atlanticum]